MATSRKDNKNRVLRKGESQRSDGTYMYRYTDSLGKRQCVYSRTLSDLRKKEESIRKDIEDGINTNGAQITLNELFERYMALKNIAHSSRVTYNSIWNSRIKSNLGQMKISDIKKSDILTFFHLLKDDGLRNRTIIGIGQILSGCLQFAVDDDLIRKNPCSGCLKEFPMDSCRKNALTLDEQTRLLSFVKGHNVYKKYYPMLVFMIETALRCGELVGLTWDDVDFSGRAISVNHQIIYKKKDGRCQFYITSPKSKAGNRVIPLTSVAINALKEQRKFQFSSGRQTTVVIDGYSDFVFSTRNQQPYIPSLIDQVLAEIVIAYNKNTDGNVLPHISAHILRHTGCTRMSEAGIDMKVLQYIMGHSQFNVTMDIYNHASEDRNRAEMDKFESRQHCMEIG